MCDFIISQPSFLCQLSELLFNGSYVSFQSSYLTAHFAVSASCFCFQAIMHHEGHMDDGLTLSRSQNEESRTARVIRSTVFLFNRFIRCAFRIIYSSLLFFPFQFYSTFPLTQQGIIYPSGKNRSMLLKLDFMSVLCVNSR